MSDFSFPHRSARSDQNHERHETGSPVVVAGPWGRRWGRLLGAAVLAAFLAVGAAGCKQSAAGPARGPKAVEVVVTTPVTGEVTDYQDFTGRLSAIKTIDIRARVSGYVDKVPFKEGDVVHKGDLLFQIDPRSYQADLNLAEANLKLSKADRNLQEKIARRARALISDRAVAQEDYETAVATWEKSGATVEANGAARDRSKLYLDWTRVTAPVSGRISRRFVDPGNLVTADNTILTTLVTEDPLYAYFDVDERTYLDLAASAMTDERSWFTGLQFPVLMRLANEDEFKRAGTIDFIDNQVNANTGTVRMRGVFPNAKGTLKPGLFVRIRLPIGKPYQTLLIPDEALQSDQGRSYVWVVNKQNEVEYRPVQLGQAIQGLRAIKAPAKGKEGKEGLAKGDRVIVNGVQRVRPGTKVEVKVQPPPKPPTSSLGQLLASMRDSGRKIQVPSSQVASVQPRAPRPQASGRTVAKAR